MCSDGCFLVSISWVYRVYLYFYFFGYNVSYGVSCILSIGCRERVYKKISLQNFAIFVPTFSVLFHTYLVKVGRLTVLEFVFTESFSLTCRVVWTFCIQ